MTYELNLLSGIALAAVIAATVPDAPAPAEAHAVGPPPVAAAARTADVPWMRPSPVERA